ncbi:hypothetical protein Pmi06nite_67240 [Planotetraspora mira]|uniref:Uncharacterized protein n=1 Tax=Planotetraspora mira TaxID=58121 RepID=A0A8J3TXS3_9ACTN|nr:hypothetical protein Pmi06nite_67240 [Planotetraspora mira]
MIASFHHCRGVAGCGIFNTSVSVLLVSIISGGTMRFSYLAYLAMQEKSRRDRRRVPAARKKAATR